MIATIVAHQQSPLHPYAMGHCQPPCFHGLWNIRARLAVIYTSIFPRNIRVQASVQAYLRGQWTRVHVSVFSSVFVWRLKFFVSLGTDCPIILSQGSTLLNIYFTAHHHESQNTTTSQWVHSTFSML